MSTPGIVIAVSTAATLVVGPLLLALVDYLRTRSAPVSALPSRERAGVRARRNWHLPLTSLLLYTLAFNLTFFIQELFLVVPKALTPGLRPTLFHNNHRWDGEHPLAALFQGTGALATVLSALVCAWILRSIPQRSIALRLFLIWMVYSGLLMALPQVVVGALSPASDVGMAMQYLQLSSAAKTMAALIALAAIPLTALALLKPLLALAPDQNRIATPGARTRFVFQTATLPAFAALPLIVLFRIPREWIEVLMVPLVVTLIGTVWMQAGAWRAVAATASPNGAGSISWPLAATALLLFVFQVVLRPGVPFF
jgi:hypothetical protein